MSPARGKKLAKRNEYKKTGRGGGRLHIAMDYDKCKKYILLYFFEEQFLHVSNWRGRGAIPVSCVCSFAFANEASQAKTGLRRIAGCLPYYTDR